MGDAVCGPSNPLQAFRKQTQVDRSLQQDRLTSRSSAAAQGFRSAPGPNAGILDAEFEAFQNGGGMGMPAPELHHGPLHAGPAFQPHQSHQMPGPAAAAGAGGWAADFQRLHISQQPAPRPQQGMSNWHQEFAQQHRALTPQPSMQSSYQPQTHQNFSYASNYMPQTGFSATLPQYGQDLNTAGYKGKETFDDAAFELEFQRHANEALEQQARDAEELVAHGPEEQHMHDTAMMQSQDLGDLTASTSQRKSAKSHFDAEMNPLQEWAEALRQNEVEETIKEAQEDVPAPMAIDEDLARTAGELLERVADDDSDKFRNSEFLRLMRRVRDGEATIRDGKMLDGEQDESATEAHHLQGDADLGRHDAHMAGALRRASGVDQTFDDDPRQRHHGRWDAEQYGRHTVDDF